MTASDRARTASGCPASTGQTTAMLPGSRPAMDIELSREGQRLSQPVAERHWDQCQSSRTCRSWLAPAARLEVAGELAGWGIGGITRLRKPVWTRLAKSLTACYGELEQHLEVCAYSGNPAFRSPSINSFAFDCPPRAIYADTVKAGSISSTRAAASWASPSRPRWAKADASHW